MIVVMDGLDSRTAVLALHRFRSDRFSAIRALPQAVDVLASLHELIRATRHNRHNKAQYWRDQHGEEEKANAGTAFAVGVCADKPTEAKPKHKEQEKSHIESLLSITLGSGSRRGVCPLFAPSG
jgi:hypothetical protein